MRILVLLVLMPLFLVACATSSSLDSKSLKGRMLNVYNHSYDEVYNAAYESLSDGFKLESADKNTGVIKASKSVSAFSWGEVMSVSISPIPNETDAYYVKVVSLKRYQLQYTGDDLEGIIINNIRNKLRM